MIYGWGFYSEIALRWMSLDSTDDKSTLVQVMAWSHQASKSLSEPMLTQFYAPIWIASLGHKELKN